MSINVSFDYIKKEKLVNFEEYKDKIAEIHNTIHNKTGKGAEFLGWLDYAMNLPQEEIDKIIEKANYFRSNYEALIVCGIGGSYLGSRATIDALNGIYSNDKLEIFYLGNSLDSTYTASVLNHLKSKKYGVIVISKSGTTTETSISFRIIKKDLEEKFGKEYARKSIVAITDENKGLLRELAIKEGYDTFNLDASIGGRFSVMTAVGLLPIACAGIDIKELIAGFKEGTMEYNNPNIYENKAYRYALERHYLYKLGYSVEMLVTYEQSLRMLNEWWKQLFDESEGKEGKAVLTASSTFTTDLHSLGQFMQEGSKILYETVIYVDEPKEDIEIPYEEQDFDELNYLSGKTISYINNKAYLGTLAAHANEANIPIICINIDKLTPRTFGKLCYFFMKACAMSGYLLGINPFNQPGVEIYKKNMFHLLGKKGF